MMIAYINSLHCPELFQISLSNSLQYVMNYFCGKFFQKSSWLHVDNQDAPTIQKSWQRFLGTICTQQDVLAVGGSGMVLFQSSHIRSGLPTRDIYAISEIILEGGNVHKLLS